MPLDHAVSPARDAAAGGFARPTRDRIRDVVATILANRLPARGFSDDETLAEIGVSSVDMVMLLFAVESEFNVEVPQHEITADVFRSIATIDGLIGRLLPPATTLRQ
jgi:acyl carrier protein